MADMEEKVQYQSDERLRDVHEVLENCQTRVSLFDIYLKSLIKNFNFFQLLNRFKNLNIYHNNNLLSKELTIQMLVL